jgi:hypothetical protein
MKATFVEPFPNPNGTGPEFDTQPNPNGIGIIQRSVAAQRLRWVTARTIPQL